MKLEKVASLEGDQTFIMQGIRLIRKLTLEITMQIEHLFFIITY
jgi:hypothetical protein